MNLKNKTRNSSIDNQLNVISTEVQSVNTQIGSINDQVAIIENVISPIDIVDTIETELTGTLWNGKQVYVVQSVVAATSNGELRPSHAAVDRDETRFTTNILHITDYIVNIVTDGVGAVTLDVPRQFDMNRFSFTVTYPDTGTAGTNLFVPGNFSLSNAVLNDVLNFTNVFITRSDLSTVALSDFSATVPASNDQTLEVAIGTLTSGISNKQVDVIIAESGAVYPIGLVNPAYLLRVEYTKI
jgi:hypothetical protein